MAKGDSRRVYITLNKNKHKDRIIENYLSQSYSESDAIKEAIYRLAINNISMMSIDAISTEKVQTVPKGNKEVQKGAINTKEVEKGVLPNSGNKDIKGDVSTEKVQFTTNNIKTEQQVDKTKVDEKKAKLLSGLNYFNKRN